MLIWGSKIEFFEKRKSVLKSAQKVDKIKYPQIFQKPSLYGCWFLDPSLERNAEKLPFIMYWQTSVMLKLVRELVKTNNRWLVYSPEAIHINFVLLSNDLDWFYVRFPINFFWHFFQIFLYWNTVVVKKFILLETNGEAEYCTSNLVEDDSTTHLTQISGGHLITSVFQWRKIWDFFTRRWNTVVFQKVLGYQVDFFRIPIPKAP